MISALLLGPSGIGKSTLGPGLAAAWPPHGFVDLDSTLAAAHAVSDLASALLTWGPERFHARSMALLAQLDTNPARLLVAVGAGSQLADAGSLDLLSYPSLCLWARPAWLWARNRTLRQDPRLLAQFIQVEYHPRRQKLYADARARIDLTGLDQAQAQAECLKILKADFAEP